MDRIYKDLISNTKFKSQESVHHTDFPKKTDKLINKKLQLKIRKAQKICSLVLSIRKKEKIKVRQPLSKIMVPYDSKSEKEELIDISDLIKSEVNVKEVELITGSSGILVKKVKPNFRSLGPKLGKKLSEANLLIQKFGDKEIKQIESGELIKLNISGKETVFEPSDFEIYSEDIEGWLVASEEGTTVALDVSLNEKLINEGISRELVNRIQNLRKEIGLKVTDKIILKFQNDNIIEKAIFENKKYITDETLSVDLIFEKYIENGTEVSFDNVKTKISIKKI